MARGPSSDRPQPGPDVRITSERPHEVEKRFYDYAEDIEAVNIHYAVTPVGELPDWENQRSTRFMPLVPDPAGETSRLRVRTLRLPGQIETETGQPTGRYLLHHYFEVCQGGSRHYSPHFSEVIETGV
jgi:hypothetical protein